MRRRTLIGLAAVAVIPALVLGPAERTGEVLTSAGASSTPLSPSLSRSPSPGSTSSPTPSPDPSRSPTPAAGNPLAGRVIVIDPGHNGGNGAHPEIARKLVDIGNGRKACDSTGTSTNAGYPEHRFTWDLANRLADLLRGRGATVILTRSGDDGVGPCITERAAIGNRARADLAVSLHADGGPATGRGFHVIAPARVRGNEAILAPSLRLSTHLRAALRAAGEPYATYTGGGRGLTVRSDLGGLNLSRVPKVFVECANMRNAGDAAHVIDPGWRQRIAVALADGMAAHLRAEGTT